MAHVPRLYVEQDLAAGAVLPLEREHAHRLLTVMRRKAGDPVRLFNGRDGEWRAELTQAGRRSAVLSVQKKLRDQTAPPDLRLFFAPVKKARTDFIVEKATELGARAITPVFTRYTQSERVRSDRIQALIREAAEQTERLDLPSLGEAMGLEDLLATRGEAVPLIFCDEGGDAPPLLEALRAIVSNHPTHNPSPQGEGNESASQTPSPEGEGWGGVNRSSLSILIGPEGGFSDEERAALRAAPGVIPVSLGPRILRADTAAAAALSLAQAVWGDWR